MTRITKDPKIRRQEIIITAQKLFTINGYNKTPIEAIIKEIGIAKGTFYYYFKSKQEILAAIVDQIAVNIEKHYIQVVKAEGISAKEKLRIMLRGEEKKENTDNATMDILHKPENRELQEEINIKAVEIIAPLLAQVIEQGNEEGIFNAPSPLESVQILLAGSNFLLDSGLFDNWTGEKKLTVLQTLQFLLEKAVGVKAGELSFISEV